MIILFLPTPSIFTSSYSPSHPTLCPFFLHYAQFVLPNYSLLYGFLFEHGQLSWLSTLRKKLPPLSQKLNIAKSFLGRRGICTQLPFDSVICFATSLHRFCVLSQLLECLCAAAALEDTVPVGLSTTSGS